MTRELVTDLTFSCILLRAQDSILTDRTQEIPTSTEEEDMVVEIHEDLRDTTIARAGQCTLSREEVQTPTTEEETQEASQATSRATGPRRETHQWDSLKAHRTGERDPMPHPEKEDRVAAKAWAHLHT